jgi:putative PIN family toxin of toxin-antitoxin system
VSRSVFDCVILLQAAGRPIGPAGKCLEAERDGRLELFVSSEILAEVRDVLNRPKTRRRFPTLTPEAVDVFLLDLVSHATTFSTVPEVFSRARDPKDEPYVNLAAAAKARYLVSRDNDLLDLMGDSTFRQQFPELTVIDPVGLLCELARQAGSDSGTGVARAEDEGKKGG